MITKETTYKKAFLKKSNILNEREANYNVLLSAAYSAENRLSEIDYELSKIGAELALTALSGNTKKLENMQKISNRLVKEKQSLLAKNGVSPIVYDCEVCKDTGYVKGKICECIKREAAQIIAEELSREMPLENCKFENFDLKYYSDKTDASGENARRRMTSILKLCKEYAIGFSPETSKNLLFLGNTGLGKTHLSLAIVSAVIEKGYMPIYASCENLFSEIESEKFSGKNNGTYEAVLNADLLVIDDLGTEMTTSFTKSVLYNIVNTRILSGLPTIINTNLSMKEIESRYTARVLSRFIGEYDWNKFLGEDIRQQKLLKK